MNVTRLLDLALDATADQAAAKARVDAIRATLYAEALARWQADAAAPTWKSRAGTVRLDGTMPAPRLEVADPAAFGSYVAERNPDKATATITVPADALEEALTALDYAGVKLDATVTADPKYTTELLEALDPVVDDSVPITYVVDPVGIIATPGEVVDVPGLAVVVPPPAPRLVVSLNPERKATAVADAKAAAELDAADATAEPDANA